MERQGEGVEMLIWIVGVHFFESGVFHDGCVWTFVNIPETFLSSIYSHLERVFGRTFSVRARHGTGRLG